MPAPDDGFDQIINEEWDMNATQTAPRGPYGQPVYDPKPGLTRRGKAAIAISVTVLASGGMLGYQHYSAQQSAASVKSQELSLKQQELRIQELKELNKAKAVNQKVQETHDAAQQKQIDACVDADKGLIGKQLGVTYGSVLEDCQSQYSASSSAGADMQEAASATDADSGGSGAGQGLLIGGGVLVLFVAFAAKRSTRSNPA